MQRLSEMHTPLLDMKPYQKLRVINNELYIDERKGSSIRRRMTGDSRWKVLEIIKELARNDEENAHFLKHIINILINTTYKNDKKWIEELQAFNPYKSGDYSEFLQLNCV